MTHKQVMTLYDAERITLKMLAQRRTSGRMRLFHAVEELYEYEANAAFERILKKLRAERFPRCEDADLDLYRMGWDGQ
jgi:hypothetical protein